MNGVIVIGGNHHNTLSVIRALGFQGIKPNLIVVCDSKYPYIQYSRYLAKVEKVNSVELVGDCLQNNFLDSSFKPIVIACSDEISSYLDCNQDTLGKHFILPGSTSQGSLYELMDKTNMAKLAVESGLKIPNSHSVRIDLLSKSFIQSLDYPVITKPLKSIEGSKADIHIFEKYDDFLASKDSFKCRALQIQDYIEKDFEFQLIGCSLDAGKEIIVPGASIILRQPRNTNTGFLRYVPISHINPDIEACKRFLQKAGYSGLFSMEFIRGKDGIDYFMETNFRNDGNAICVTAAGVNLPYIWVLHNSGVGYKSYLNSCQIHEILAMPEFSDFKNVISGRISLMTWIKDVRRTNAFMDWSKKDQLPFWGSLPTKIVNKLLK